MTSSGREGARGTLLVADRIVTLGHGRYRARAVLVRGKRVVWVGDDPDEAPGHGERIEFPGCTIGPAFVDAHVHLTSTGITLSGLDLSRASSGAELLDAVRTYSAQHDGRVVWGHGYDPHAFADELPDPDQLLEAGHGMAVYLSRVDGHSCLVDRKTLSAAPLARAEGIERDPHGDPTGVLRREANHIIRRWSIGAMTESELRAARIRVGEHAAALGIASVHEMGGPDIMGDADFDAWLAGDWPIEVIAYWGGLDLSFVVERELKQIGGDLFLDGSLGSHTAALSEPYADAPHEQGHLEYDDETVIDLFREATHAGVQVGVHAIGDAAIAQALRCWRRVDDELPDYLEFGVRRLRHRIEHAEVLPPELLDEVADLGLVVSAQPPFDTVWGGPGKLYERRLGPERESWMNPYRALADRGVPLAFGSDANVTPMDPWGVVRAAENRAHERHAITRLEAVSATTLGGRHAARQDRWVGTIRAGMRADVAVWDGDPYAADDPTGAHCVLTLLKGRVTHGDASLPHWDDAPRVRSAATTEEASAP
ncbi:MAG: amidohydrolase [Actinobacteria bacterium]|nr:amidohydrolase [Actinomycetota bacterium]